MTFLVFTMHVACNADFPSPTASAQSTVSAVVIINDPALTVVTRTIIFNALVCYAYPVHI